LAFAVALAMLGGCAQDAAEGEKSGPLLWQVTSPGGQTMYMFGSIHAADDTIYPLPEAIMDAFSRSEYLAVEADIVAFEQDGDALAAFGFAMMYTDGSTIADEIGTDLHARAIEAMAGAHELEVYLGQGFPPEMLDELRPYWWFDMLTVASIERAGMSVDHGIDRYFIERANERGMGILEIESIEMQLGMMLGFSTPLQAAMLENATEIDKNAANFRMMYDYWRQGDRYAIEALVVSDIAQLPPEFTEEYTDAILTQRDLGMVAAAERFMDEGRNVFFVVGISHFVGERNILAQLEGKGYTVEIIPVEM